MGCDDYYGPPSHPRTDEDRRKRRDGIQSTWDHYKVLMASNGWDSHRRGKLTCPQCLTQVIAEDQESHEQYHEDLLREMRDIARWTSPGLIG